MKFLTKLTAAATALVVTGATLALSFGSSASADCYPYNPNGSTTTATPVFNNFCNAPDNINNESDFVRIRHNVNGDDKDNAGNPGYSGNSISGACNDGDKFDIWNYVHNDATQDLNNNGSGSAVAHNVNLALSARGLNTTNSTFPFSATVSASNANSVSDSATLNCNGKQVSLSLVPSSVHIYSPAYGAWKDLGDGSVNSTTKIGSPTFGSGDMWGCWNYRMVTVYQVVVHVQPPVVQHTATCDLLQVMAAADRKVKVSQFGYTAQNANIKNVVLNWGDNTQPVTITGTSDDQIKQQVLALNHQYSANGAYNVTATITFAASGQADIVSGGAGTPCAMPVSFTSTGTPNTPTTPTTPATPAAPTTLVNTGAGSVVAIFAAVAAASTYAYRRYLSRSLSN